MTALATALYESATREELIAMVLEARGALRQTAQRAGIEEARERGPVMPNNGKAIALANLRSATIRVIRAGVSIEEAAREVEAILEQCVQTIVIPTLTKEQAGE